MFGNTGSSFCLNPSITTSSSSWNWEEVSPGIWFAPFDPNISISTSHRPTQPPWQVLIQKLRDVLGTEHTENLLTWLKQVLDAMKADEQTDDTLAAALDKLHEEDGEEINEQLRAETAAFEAKYPPYPDLLGDDQLLEPPYIDGLVGKRIDWELWREYEFTSPDLNEVTVYRIVNPKYLYYRPGGSTHRVVDCNNVVHCVPAPGQQGCILRWEVASIVDPVSF